MRVRRLSHTHTHSTVLFPAIADVKAKAKLWKLNELNFCLAYCLIEMKQFPARFSALDVSTHSKSPFIHTYLD